MMMPCLSPLLKGVSGAQVGLLLPHTCGTEISALHQCLDRTSSPECASLGAVWVQATLTRPESSSVAALVGALGLQHKEPGISQSFHTSTSSASSDSVLSRHRERGTPFSCSTHHVIVFVILVHGSTRCRIRFPDAYAAWRRAPPVLSQQSSELGLAAPPLPGEIGVSDFGPSPSCLVYTTKKAVKECSQSVLQIVQLGARGVPPSLSRRRQRQQLGVALTCMAGWRHPPAPGCARGVAGPGRACEEVPPAFHAAP
ncbi:hypothetical protein NDU88_006382 [Pleurodeles waltl]|uniref:Uncharacterized protein n=1 Tax=Pleurodeles waltl TaxID=8319 RepID=A0AAV7UPH2_PLEWA|nr:hypothetical protein NDU88_006382 [Pleurodeles waltl]